MSEKRYYKKEYDELYYIFDSKTLSEKEFEEKVEYDGYTVFADSLTSKEILDLLNENEELKKENYKLHKRLGDFEPYEEYIKERTSKISVNDIIGLVKTDETTNSVKLKWELYND